MNGYQKNEHYFCIKGLIKACYIPLWWWSNKKEIRAVNLADDCGKHICRKKFGVVGEIL